MSLGTVLITLAFLVIAGLFLFRRVALRRHAPQKFASTEQMMEWLADQAVDMARQDGATLDYSTDSIRLAEEALGKLHAEYLRSRSQTGVRGLASAFGAYVGECIRRAEPDSTWSQDHPVGGEKSYPLHWRGSEVFPVAWCYQRITNGPEDNVWNKFVVLSSRDSARGE